jgi:hypothetical protein
MTKPEQARLSEARRKEIFLALLTAAREPDTDGREAIARRFGLSEEQLTSIERDGVARCWPPLD